MVLQISMSAQFTYAGISPNFYESRNDSEIGSAVERMYRFSEA
jgi:hypothetical protein